MQRPERLDNIYNFEDTTETTLKTAFYLGLNNEADLSGLRALGANKFDHFKLKVAPYSDENDKYKNQAMKLVIDQTFREECGHLVGVIYQSGHKNWEKLLNITDDGTAKNGENDIVERLSDLDHDSGSCFAWLELSGIPKHVLGNKRRPKPTNFVNFLKNSKKTTGNLVTIGKKGKPVSKFVYKRKYNEREIRLSGRKKQGKRAQRRSNPVLSVFIEQQDLRNTKKYAKTTILDFKTFLSPKVKVQLSLKNLINFQKLSADFDISLSSTNTEATIAILDSDSDPLMLLDAKISKQSDLKAVYLNELRYRRSLNVKANLENSPTELKISVNSDNLKNSRALVCNEYPGSRENPNCYHSQLKTRYELKAGDKTEEGGLSQVYTKLELDQWWLDDRDSFEGDKDAWNQLKNYRVVFLKNSDC